MGELITRYVKLGIAFVLLWGLLVVYNSVGCRQVKGAEMEPTVPRESHRMIFPQKFRPGEQVGYDDMVYYEYVQAGESQQGFASRVIGLPGDRIRIEKGDVYRNDRKVDAGYVGRQNMAGDSYEEIIVPRGSYFVLMDNRNHGWRWDSRGFGPIGMYAVDGRLKP